MSKDKQPELQPEDVTPVSIPPEPEPPPRPVVQIRKPTFQFTDDSTDAFAKIMVYGPSGYGKTRLLSTAMADQRTSPLFLIDYEGGTSSIRGTGVKRRKIETWEDFNETYEYLASGDHPFKSIALDSASEAHLFALFQRLQATDRRRTNADALDENDYGLAATQMRRLIRKFRDLPYHFFATALSQEVTDVREGVVKKPAMSGKLADDLMGIFDCVGYLAKDGDGADALRVLVLQNYSKIRTKIRIPPELPQISEIDDPTISKILDAMGF
jgi:hypothetical protein